MTEVTVGYLAELVGGKAVGDREIRVRGIAPLNVAEPDHISFVRNPSYKDAASASHAGALIVGPGLEFNRPHIVADDVEVAFAKIALHFYPQPRAEEHDIHPTAVVDPSADIASPVRIGPHVVVEAGVRIGAGSIIGASSVIGAGSVLGEDCVLHARVTLYHRVWLGNRVVLSSGVVLGADGFGFKPDAKAEDGKRWLKIPQVGDVVIEDDVEIGANSTVDRAAMGTTRVGAGSKIDNVVHIGHNCVLGKDNVIAGFSAFGGSTILGDRVTCGGHIVTAGHLEITNDVRIGGNSGLLGDITESGDYMGYPLQKRTRWGRTFYTFDRLVELKARVRDLERDG